MSPSKPKASRVEIDLRPTDRPHELLERSFGRTMLVYFSLLGGIIGVSIAGAKLAGILPLRTGLILLGIVYLLGAAGRPRALYLTLRGSRQFARVADPRAVRRSLLAFGVLFVGLGLLMPLFVQALIR